MYDAHEPGQDFLAQCKQIVCTQEIKQQGQLHNFLSRELTSRITTICAEAAMELQFDKVYLPKSPVANCKHRPRWQEMLQHTFLEKHRF
eukprot:1037248-Pelagomonas_calceolata.AAC.2